MNLIKIEIISKALSTADGIYANCSFRLCFLRDQRIFIYFNLLQSNSINFLI